MNPNDEQKTSPSAIWSICHSFSGIDSRVDCTGLQPLQASKSQKAFRAYLIKGSVTFQGPCQSNISDSFASKHVQQLQLSGRFATVYAWKVFSVEICEKESSVFLKFVWTPKVDIPKMDWHVARGAPRQNQRDVVQERFSICHLKLWHKNGVATFIYLIYWCQPAVLPASLEVGAIL